jgi:uncharacterized membrane protein YiaA
VQNAVTFRPNQIQVVDIAFVTVIEADLVVGAVIFQLPVGWGRDNQMNGFVFYLAHLPTVAIDYLVNRLHFFPLFMFFFLPYP